MGDGTSKNLVTLFFEQAERLGEAPFLWAKREGHYQPVTWRETADQVSALSRGLTAIGLGAGDRIALVAENRPEWLIADLAIMAAGGITVPAYITNTVDDHHHILQDSGAKGAIVSTARLAERLLPAAHRTPETSFLVAMEPLEVQQHLDLELATWDDLLARGRESNRDVVEDARRLGRDDTACIIYTSGTGGAPKGVVLGHGAILHNCAGAVDALMELGLGEEVFLSFLPLSHSYEHTGGQFFPISIGAQIYYAEGIETLATNMLEARPTLMTAVPRLYESLHARITRDVRKAGGLKERLFITALKLGTRRLLGQPMSLGQRIADRVVDRLVRDKVRARFGGRLKALVSGGAPLNPEIGLFFSALGLRVLQGYGQTEAAPVVSVNRVGHVKFDTVGTPIKDTEVRIAEDGEILVRGALLMQGYWNNPEATAETIRDGWLHTGDVGIIDQDGHLKITDRKKDIIVNSGGDNLSPQRVEGILALEPEIAQAMVYGDRRPHLVGLLVADQDWAAAWAREHGKPASPAELADDPDFHKAMGAAVERVNRSLSTVEKVRRFKVAEAPFAIENGQLTPTMKIRRHKIKEVYGKALEALYG